MNPIGVTRLSARYIQSNGLIFFSTPTKTPTKSVIGFSAPTKDFFSGAIFLCIQFPFLSTLALFLEVYFQVNSNRMNRRMLGIILIVAGAIILAAGVALVATSEKQKVDNELFDASASNTVRVTQPVRVAEPVAASVPRQPESQPIQVREALSPRRALRPPVGSMFTIPAPMQ